MVKLEGNPKFEGAEFFKESQVIDNQQKNFSAVEGSVQTIDTHTD